MKAGIQRSKKSRAIIESPQPKFVKSEVRFGIKNLPKNGNFKIPIYLNALKLHMITGVQSKEAERESGVIEGKVNGDELLLHQFSPSKNFGSIRHRNIGKITMDKIVDMAKNENIKQIRLVGEVVEPEFYRSQGFYRGVIKPLDIQKAKKEARDIIRLYSDIIPKWRINEYKQSMTQKIRDAQSIREIDDIVKMHENIVYSLIQQKQKMMI